MKPLFHKNCKACGSEYETVYPRQRLCPNCRLDRQLNRIDQYIWQKKLEYRMQKTQEAL